MFAFSPFSAPLFLFAGSFIISLFFTGMLISLVQQSMQKSLAITQSKFPLPLITAHGFLVLSLLLVGSMMILARYNSSMGWFLLLPGFLGSAFLMLFTQFFLGQSERNSFFQIPIIVIHVVFIIFAILFVFLLLPADLFFFQGDFSLMGDRLIAGSLLVIMTLLFQRADVTSGSGYLLMTLTGITILLLPLLLASLPTLLGFFDIQLQSTLNSMPWPSGWFGLGLVFFGTGLGVLYWLANGYQLPLSPSGRLGHGLAVSILLLSLMQYTSFMVLLVVLTLPLTLYIFYPSIVWLGRCLIDIFDLQLKWPSYQVLSSGQQLTGTGMFCIVGLYILILCCAAISFYFPLIGLLAALLITLISLLFFK